ncbi:MAG: hypothetical protein AUK03_02650 [Anaerolineae bacterium CG2_30_64_16]|nr:MAG: hypothetical protein AUK03_02650 [Anaerolineae bacterium CG2_30_64_16]
MKRSPFLILSLLIVLTLAILPASLAAQTAPPSAATPHVVVPAQAAESPVTATPAPPPPQMPQPDALALFGGMQSALQEIYQQVNPSVVHIWERKKLAELFAWDSEPDPAAATRPMTWRNGLGSGFVWDDQGHIVTNNHVIEGADRLFVTFSSGLIAEATVVGQDKRSDLAVLHVDVPAGQLHPVTIADSTAVQVGQFVVAIGNPWDYAGTMTFGIVSALARSLSVWDEAQPFGSVSDIIPDVIQIDAPINPGNSGGVLVDMAGRVIGVTSNGAGGVRWSVGIAFAIPSVIVARVAPALIETGAYSPPWLGLNTMALTPELAEAMKLAPEQQGALTLDVTADGPADQAGVRGSSQRVTIEDEDMLIGGDLIVAIDGEPILVPEAIDTYLVRHTDPGQEVVLTVLREGEPVNVPVVVGVRPEAPAETPAPAGPAKEGVWLGVSGVNLIPALAEVMGLPAEQRGVLVQTVITGSPADEAGVRGGYKAYSLGGSWIMVGGDVIVALDEGPVETVADLGDLLAAMTPGQEAVLTLLRDAAAVQVAVTLVAWPGVNAQMGADR